MQESMGESEAQYQKIDANNAFWRLFHAICGLIILESYPSH